MPKHHEIGSQVQLISFPYVCEIDSCSSDSRSRHFDCPAGRRYFEGVAGVEGNTCIERGRNLIRLHGQTNGRFSRSGYTQNMLRLSMSLATINTLRAYRPTLGTGRLNSVQI